MSRWMVSPVDSLNGCWRTAGGSPIRSRASRRSRSRSLWLGRCPRRATLQPAFHRRHTILAAAAVCIQVGLRFGRRDQSEVPGILGGALEPKLVEGRRESEQHTEWGREPKPVRSHVDVTSGVVPPSSVEIDERWNGGPERVRNGQLDSRRRHLSKSIEVSGCPGAEESVVAGTEESRHAASHEREFVGGQLKDPRRKFDENTASSGSAHRRGRPPVIVDQLLPRHHPVLAGRGPHGIRIEHAHGVGGE